jgi:hypothetical protein
VQVPKSLLVECIFYPDHEAGTPCVVIMVSPTTNDVGGGIFGISSGRKLCFVLLISTAK